MNKIISIASIIIMFLLIASPEILDTAIAVESEEDEQLLGCEGYDTVQPILEIKNLLDLWVQEIVELTQKKEIHCVDSSLDSCSNRDFKMDYLNSRNNLLNAYRSLEESSKSGVR